MKPLSISIASAAILAAASFGAHAQGQPPVQENQPGTTKAAPSQGGQTERSTQPSGEKPGGREAQTTGSDRPAAGDKERPARADAADKPGQAGDKADQKSSAEKAGDGTNKADKSAEKTGDMNKDGKTAEKPAGDASKSAEQDKAGDKPGKQATKEIRPEQKTVIKQTIVRENIRPQKLDVQVRVGVRIPRTVVLYSLPPTIIEVYPAYSRYKLVMVDDDTILVIDPVDWEIIDVIQV
jgi:Protein of unknown function (DUF1236)